MMKQLSSSNIKEYVPRVLLLLKQYGVFLFVITFLGLYIYQVNHIGQLIRDEPSQAAVDGQLKPISKLKIDKDSIKKITDLESRNIELKTLFEDARQNPFLDCPSGRLDANQQCIR